ncbi:MAG: hypothetical protein NTV62_00585 [Candidatus Gribaldobacteria bacterium]|nr:hypothetical protein [Candidatus Gribaldobacteria bacterium]
MQITKEETKLDDNCVILPKNVKSAVKHLIEAHTRVTIIKHRSRNFPEGTIIEVFSFYLDGVCYEEEDLQVSGYMIKVIKNFLKGQENKKLAKQN